MIAIIPDLMILDFDDSTFSFLLQHHNWCEWWEEYWWCTQTSDIFRTCFYETQEEIYQLKGNICCTSCISVMTWLMMWWKSSFDIWQYHDCRFNQQTLHQEFYNSFSSMNFAHCSDIRYQVTCLLNLIWKKHDCRCSIMLWSWEIG